MNGMYRWDINPHPRIRNHWGFILLITLLCVLPTRPALDAGAVTGSSAAGHPQLILAAQAPVQEYEAPPGVDQAAVIAHHNQGNQFLALEMWEEAREQFRSAIALDPANPYSYNGLALAQYGQQQYDAAIRSCLTAIELMPDYAYVRCTLALALFYSGNAASATEVLEDALGLSQPGDSTFSLATALLKKFRQEQVDAPGTGSFSLAADDEAVSDFLEARESFEDIFVSTPYNGSPAPAPGGASAEYERLREQKVQQLISDTDELLRAAGDYAAVVNGMEAAVLTSATAVSGSGAAAAALEERIHTTLGALQAERRAAGDFIARLDTSSQDLFVSRSLEYQRSLMALRGACLQLEETDRLIMFAALLIRQARDSMPQAADAIEQQLLADLAIHDQGLGQKARLDNALHHLDDGLRALDTADYYYGLEALAFMDSQLAEVRFRAMNLRTSDRIDDDSASAALATVDYLAQLGRELQEQFDNMDSSRMLTEQELSALAGEEGPSGGMQIALAILAISPAHADDAVYSQNVRRALQRDRRLFDRSTSEYEGITHAVGGMVRFTQDLAGSTVDMADALVSTAVIPVAGMVYGDSGAEIWNEVKGKYRAVGENYRNGTSGTRVLRTATEYMEAAEGMAERGASGTVRVLSDATVGGGNLAPWVAGKLAKTGVGLFTALGKGVNKVLDPTSTPGEVSHGVLHIGLTVASAGTSGLTAPVQSVSGAMRTAAGAGSTGGMQEMAAALGQGYITDSGKELIEWGGDKLTGFEDRPNPFLGGNPPTPTVAVAPPDDSGGRNAGGGTSGNGNGSGGEAVPVDTGTGSGNGGNGSGAGGSSGGNDGGAGGTGSAGGTGAGGGPSSGGGSGEGLPPQDTDDSSALPSCSITASPAAGAPPLAVTFTLSGSDSAGQAITSFELSGGGLSGPLQVGGSHSMQFASPGEFTVTAVAIDARGRRSSPATCTVSVFAPPKAVIGGAPADGYGPLQVNFDFSGSTASGEGVQRYVFNDGKGGTHDSASVSLSYDATGGKQSYNVSLVVYDEAGNASEPATASFNVYSEPVAAIRLGTELGEAPLSVAIDGTASQCFNGSFSRVSITDNIGNSASSLSGSFVYDEPGTYEITLAVTDAGGKESKVSASVEVTPPLLTGLLIGSFSAPAPGRLELTLNAEAGTFSGYVSGGVQWTWGDLSGSEPYTGTLSGSYDPQTGVLGGSLTGVCNEKSFNGSFSGKVSGGSASGSWAAANEDGEYAGTWTAGG